MLYPAFLRKDGDSVVLLFPDFPEGHTNGKDDADAIRHAPDALKTIISMWIEAGRDIPKPSRPKRKCVYIGLPSPVDEAKIELYSELRRQNVRKAELARRMGIHKQQVERLMDLDHASRIEQLAAAFRALGKQLRITIAA